MYFRIVVVLFSCMMLLNCQSNSSEETTLRIATAANVQFAMRELTKVFEDQTNIKTEIVLGSSGKLTAQIQQGAPYHLFVSANMKYPNTLYDAGLTTSKPVIYALGQLVLWSTHDNTNLNLKTLTANHIQHIALANPKTAPYGMAAIELLKNAGLYEALKPKLVFGESIAQTNQFILTKAAEAGFTAKSVVIAPTLKNRGVYYTIPDTLYASIQQGIVVLKHQDKAVLEYANQFRAFILSPKAQAILEEYGYVFE